MQLNPVTSTLPEITGMCDLVKIYKKTLSMFQIHLAFEVLQHKLLQVFFPYSVVTKLCNRYESVAIFLDINSCKSGAH